MKSFLILLFIALLQNTSAQITVTMLSDTNQPIVGETISFANEQQEVLASCITNTNGRCTISLTNPPTQGNGLIRGTLITEHGRRPIIFKGELLEITLTLDETEQLHIPSDAYVTRTPQSSPIPEPTAIKAQPETTATTTSQPEPTAIKAQPETTATATSQPEPTAIKAQPETTAPSAPSGNLYFWVQLGLIMILIAAAMIYIWATQKQNQP